MNWVSEIGFSGTWNQPKNGLKRQVEQGFSSFLPNFLTYLITFQSFAAPSVNSTLKNHQKYAKK